MNKYNFLFQISKNASRLKPMLGPGVPSPGCFVSCTGALGLDVHLESD
jgi:hypothetical protein